MSDRKLMSVLRGMFIALGLGIVFGGPAIAGAKRPKIDVPFLPTRHKAVELMLKMAKVTKDDTVYDLGCGDGRIVVMAVKKFGARGLGIDINPQRIKESKENAKKAGVTDRVQFKLGDIRDADLSSVTVVTLFLLPSVNVMIRPKLFAELKPGTRVVSNGFNMADWKHDREVRQQEAYGGVVYLWIIPAPVGGTWRWRAKVKDVAKQCSLTLEQQFQAVRGTVTLPGAQEATITDASLAGCELTCTAKAKIGGQEVKVVYRGTVEGDTIKGTQEWKGGPNAGRHPWTAKRAPVDVAGTWRMKVKSQELPLDGTLRLERKDGKLTATYVFDKDKRSVAVPALYVWGESVRFELPTDGQPVTFQGSLGAQAGKGTAQRDSSTSKMPWSAQKQK